MAKLGSKQQCSRSRTAPNLRAAHADTDVEMTGDVCAQLYKARLARVLGIGQADVPAHGLRVARNGRICEES
jgi:hypothetical protein